MSNALVIIPTYNEKENIVQIINAVMEQPKDFHLLIIDDNSPDGTAELVKGMQSVLNNDTETKLHMIQRSGKLGLGTAYIEGFRFAMAKGYDYVLEMDADFSHDPRDLQRLYFACSEDGHDLAVGSRYSTGVNVVNWSMKRVLMSYFASRYVRIITGIPLHDTTAGFVCYKRQVLEKIPLHKVKFVGYAFQIEMKFLTWKYGFKLVEVPIVFTDRTLGQSKMSVGIFKEGFWGVIQMEIASWFKSYK